MRKAVECMCKEGSSHRLQAAFAAERATSRPIERSGCGELMDECVREAMGVRHQIRRRKRNRNDGNSADWIKRVGPDFVCDSAGSTSTSIFHTEGSALGCKKPTQVLRRYHLHCVVVFSCASAPASGVRILELAMNLYPVG